MSKEPKRNVYVGHRYVPKIMGEWDETKSYEGLTIVTYQGASYTSKKRVPVGIDILDEEYWVVTGNYNAQIEFYRQDVKNLETKVEQDISEVEQELSKTMKLLPDMITVTVGEGGDFSTINDALKNLSYERPVYKKSVDTSEMSIRNKPVNLLLLSGFVMKEQVMLEGGVDLGYITISSEDDVVPVERSSLVDVASYHRKPIFSGHFNCVLPIINTLFEIDNSDSVLDEDDNTTGIYVVGNSSVIVTKGNGVRGAGRGLHVNGGSSAYVRESDFSSNYWGIRVSQGSYLSGRDMIANDCVRGVAVAEGCNVEIRGATINECLEEAIHCSSSIVNFSYGKSSNNKGHSTIRANYNAKIDIKYADVSNNAGFGIYACFGGEINASYANVVNNSDGDMVVYNIGSIVAYETTTTNSEANGTPNLIDTNVGSFNTQFHNGTIKSTVPHFGSNRRVGASVGNVRSNSVVVGASNSILKELADLYSYDDQTDHSMINLAISYLGDNGGTIKLLEGTYFFDGQVTVPDNVIIEGSGYATKIVQINNEVTRTFYISGNNSVVKNLSLDGNGLEYGIQAIGENYTIKDCHIKNAQYGIYGTNGSQNTRIKGNFIDECSENGIRLSNTNFVKVIENTVINSGDGGIRTHTSADNTIINNNHLYNNTINLRDNSETSIIGVNYLE